MIKKFINNIYSSGIEQFIVLLSQFVSGVIIIRTLPREEYGLLGIAAGYFVFLQVLNISAESIILRDHKLYETEIEKRLKFFISFSYIKFLLFVVITCVLGGYLTYALNSYNVFLALGISLVVMSSQFLTSPFVLYQSSKLNHSTVTKITSIKVLTRLVLLIGLFYNGSLAYYFIVELFTAIFFVFIWYYNFAKRIEIGIWRLITPTLPTFGEIKEVIFGYSLWVHLTSVISNFVYRSDTFFLSFFVGLTEIGNYNIVLNTANLVGIFPSMLGAQNSIALSNVESDREIESITKNFIKVSLYITIFTFIGICAFGYLYLDLITNDDITFMYSHLLLISLSLLIIKALGSPILALINIKGDVKSFFRNVALPLFITVVITYLISAYLWGLLGIAIANLFNSLIWIVLIVREARKLPYSTNIQLKPKQDFINFRKIYK